MKLLSMWEPWAMLYVLGLKRIETRSWDTPYRGWLAIHSTKSGLSKTKLRKILLSPGFSDALPGISLEDFSPGCIIGAVELIDCCPTVGHPSRMGVFELYSELRTSRELYFGNYKRGRYGLLAAPHPIRFFSPIPFQSRQGKLLDIPGEIEYEIVERMKQARLGRSPGGVRV